jgi:nanoRNase/pAp phosphatase (c-di-AMP/oligoRNAs hydrolase)
LSHSSGTSTFPFLGKELKRAAIICHRNADADSYLSAYAVSALIKALVPDCHVVIVTPEGMTTLTERLSNKFPHQQARNEENDYDLYVAVDVGDTELLKDWLGKIRTSPGTKILIDHHPLRDYGLYDHVIVDESATSTGEVVYNLFRQLKVPPGKDVSQAMLEAIVFDSSHLAIAGEGGLRAAVGLIDAGASLSEARRDLRSEPDYGEVLAKLKGAMRLRIYKTGDWVLASSKIGSFQAHVARSLIMLGADIAVVVGETDDETRVSLRATQRFYESTGLHLGTQLAEKVGSVLGGHGGGHPTAASFSCSIGEDEALAKTLGAIGQIMGAELSEIE